jgi:hypothetical protein
VAAIVSAPIVVPEASDTILHAPLMLADTRGWS